MPTRFLFDLNSPYAYLAAERIDEVVGPDVVWQPIVFGALLGRQRRTPWSLRSGEREAGMIEVQRRCVERGLPAIAWVEGWPLETWSIESLRAAHWALSIDQRFGREVTRALFRSFFVDGRSLRDHAVVCGAIESVGGAVAELESGLADEAVKSGLRTATDEAIAADIHGVPTVVVGDEQFWGDDQLETAAAAR